MGSKGSDIGLNIGSKVLSALVVAAFHDDSLGHWFQHTPSTH